MSQPIAARYIAFLRNLPLFTVIFAENRLVHAENNGLVLWILAWLHAQVGI